MQGQQSRFVLRASIHKTISDMKIILFLILGCKDFHCYPFMNGIFILLVVFGRRLNDLLLFQT